MSATTRMMLKKWAAHRAEGRMTGLDGRHDWQTQPDWANREADEWVQQDCAWRLLIGLQLADEAIHEFEKEQDA